MIELFHGTEVLGIKPEDIDGCKIGSLGIPEFGTDFVIQMVQDTKPQTLSDLIRISDYRTERMCGLEMHRSL